ncbi:ANK_REP_REGION domain-containing protein [Trichonephila clavipes]|nr:ANK_REP_REGION domain-containing protein [Trichonephila clavipes]
MVRASDSKPKALVGCLRPPNTLRVHTENVLVKSVGPKVLWTVTAETTANPNIASDLTEQFKTPLHIASENGHLDIARLLLDYEADILAKDSSGLTAMDLAEKADHPHVMELLKAAAGYFVLVRHVRTPAQPGTGWDRGEEKGSGGNKRKQSCTNADLFISLFH